jgi:hypothetical protein
MAPNTNYSCKTALKKGALLSHSYDKSNTSHCLAIYVSKLSFVTLWKVPHKNLYIQWSLCFPYDFVKVWDILMNQSRIM